MLWRAGTPCGNFQALQTTMGTGTGTGGTHRARSCRATGCSSFGFAGYITAANTGAHLVTAPARMRQPRSGAHLGGALCSCFEGLTRRSVSHRAVSQLVAAMCVCRSWHAAGGAVFNAALVSATGALRCVLPRCVLPAEPGDPGAEYRYETFAHCNEGLGDGPASMEECVACWFRISPLRT